MTKKVLFTKEFEHEAVRLAETSGRTRRETADDLGIGLSTLTRWLSRNRDAVMDDPGHRNAHEDMVGELTRLRRENEILRQERDILKKATAFSPRREGDEVQLHRSGETRVPRTSSSQGFRCQPERLFCLERPAGKSSAARRYTDSQHAFPIAHNIIAQDFAATGPNQKWGADISYIWTREGWIYLAVVIDLFSRHVVGWAVGDRLHRELAINAFRKAIVMRRPKPGLIHHSDRGSQYCSLDYQALLRSKGILISMSGKGNCDDNAMIETFFKTLKSGLIWRAIYQTRKQAEIAFARYINGFYNDFYNPIRRHSALDYLSPAQFERLAR